MSNSILQIILLMVCYVLKEVVSESDAVMEAGWKRRSRAIATQWRNIV